MKRNRILVPRLMDAENFNAQNLNAKALLGRVKSDDHVWTATHYRTPDSAVLKNRKVRLVRLWRHRLWLLRMWMLYLQPADALVYPGVHPVDLAGMGWRKALYPRRPIIATLEGLAGTEIREKQLSEWAGHAVYCQRVDQSTQDRIDRILHLSDHIIAISPFLAEMGRRRFGDKVSVLPLGIDAAVFYPPTGKLGGRRRVVAAGRLESHKRPDVFLATAERLRHADFIWYGEGLLRQSLTQQALARGVRNIVFPGGLSPMKLADEFRQADVFVIPSKSEGVPKVSQEAAACGLPVVLFGHYEAPSVRDGVNGFVVWNDEQFFDRIGDLLDDTDRATLMGANGARMSKEWDWDVLAPKWESAIAGMIPG
jgi:glycosyltransferase involved in cell wall biosynthesis